MDKTLKVAKSQNDKEQPKLQDANSNQIGENLSNALSVNQKSQSMTNEHNELFSKVTLKNVPDSHLKNIPEKDMDGLNSPPSPVLSPTQSESPVSFTGHGLYKLQALGIKESELGEYLFDYFSTLPQIFLNHYDHSLSSIQKMLYPCLTQQDLRIINKEKRFARGMVIFGLETDRKSTRLNSSHSQISYST